ncbi:LysM peptidoglycan-binding and 3D domain-containing protein [Neobacillus jeddahensis]|uniref:LysM peptidoglycan-binding and 3D domain-containing protein n=1 Tax=Neobacillus jeddahensis TaxID=1461580 RepID=UPI0005914372|nr:3D domain-containing protein [Neobacillus jeddahensis]
MRKTIKTFIAVAALSGTIGANVQAAELTVEKGDTLWGISQEHHTSVENIEKWNHLSTNLIHPGDVLTIATEKQYTIQQDETLWDVAVKFQVSVTQIKEWNNLNTDLVHPGLTLLIYDEVSESVKNVETETASSNSSTAVDETPLQQEELAHQENKPAPSDVNDSKEITVKATAYTASCEGCSGTTATGVDLNANPDAKVIAVDPKVIPLGSKVYVEGYGVATAADTGGAIKGNRIDVFIPTKQDALNWGNKHITVKILD